MGAANATIDSNGFIAATVNASFIPTPAQSGQLTETAAFIPGTSANYQSSSTTAAATVNVGSNEGFTITPALVTPDCSGGSCIFIPAAGQTGTSPLTVTSLGLSGSATLTCAVTARNPADLHVPGCSFTLNGATNSTVSLSGNGSSGQRTLTITTTAKSGLRAPAIRPQGGNWFIAAYAMGLVACTFLLLDLRTLKLKLAPTFALALVIIAGTAVGCGGGGNPAPASSNSGATSGSGNGGSGGGSGSGGSGGGAVSNPGTTADIYTVTVTATPSAGTAIQTQFLVAVQ